MIEMNGLDYALAGIILFSALIGFSRGIVRELISLVIWIAGFWVASNYMHVFAHNFLMDLVQDPMTRTITSFCILLVLTLLFGRMLGQLVTKTLDKIGLGALNNVVGALFGVARGSIIVSLCVMLASFTKIPEKELWKQSVAIPHINGYIAKFRHESPYKSKKIPL